MSNSHTIEEKMQAYADRHSTILSRIAVAMAGRVAPGNRWSDHKVLVVYLKDGEDGRCVHYELSVENFIGATISLGMLNDLEALVALNVIGVMIFFVCITPDGTVKVLADALLPEDRAIQLIAGAEALKASEQLDY
ncbi:hypothetical protein BD779DRAFT_1681292 [Infundibulicybe gibba]|nr:hypothetical protein BD779DRAFT_1681292 [Infundibulicybe gibba]